MANEYKLPYTANEIDTYLGQVPINKNNIETLESKINNYSWNDLKNKPFYEIGTLSNTLTWDGTDSDTIIVNFHWLSDITPSINDLINGSYVVILNGSPITVDITEDKILDKISYIKISEYIVISYIDNVVVDDYVTIPKAGIYFNKGDASNRAISLTCVNDIFTSVEGVKCINEKYIPDTIINNLVPSTTTSDNNKVLTSINGTPTWCLSSSVVSPSVDKLSGKIILCLGDSLMIGNGWQGGFANCISENHPSCTIINKAVSGATLIYNDSLNYIYLQFKEYYDAGNPAPDIILFDGGGNDCMYRAEIGTGNLDSCYINGIHTTMCDALECLIYVIKTAYPSTKLLYITTPMAMQWDTDEIPSVPPANIQLQYLEAKEKVLEKWGIPKADIHRNGNLTSCIQSQQSTYYIDSLHFNEAGYRYISPVIEDALNKLF